MLAILNLFAPVTPGEKPSPIMPQPTQFDAAELHQMSIALAYWINANPAMTAAKSAEFKINLVRGAWQTFVRERQ